MILSVPVPAVILRQPALMLVPASYLRLGCSMQELTDVYVSKAQFVPAGFFCGKTDFGRNKTAAVIKINFLITYIYAVKFHFDKKN